MAEHLLELTVVTFTANQLAIKVKNISGVSLDKRLVLELSPPAYLVDDRINKAAIAAASNENPPGAKSLAGIVSGPPEWSVWARRETSDSSLLIVFINDMDQNGNDLPAPVKFAAGAEFTVGIPLDKDANRDLVDLLYSYQHGTDEVDPPRGKIELKPAQPPCDIEVTLTAKHANPTMVTPGQLVTISWHIKNGVSATLRGPLPGGNAEIRLDTKNTDFKLADGSIEVRVVGAMTYMLQAEVKCEGKPNVEVVRMITLDTPNHKYSYVYCNPEKVLPHGLLEINWAAWGVTEVELNVLNHTGIHTTRTIPLTQQTKGRFYEGSGVMRVSATKTASETVDLMAPPIRKESASASIVSWRPLTRSDITGRPLAMAMLISKLAVLTTDGLFIAEVGEVDPQTVPAKLIFNPKSKETPRQWLSLAATDGRFVVLRRTNQDDLEAAPYLVNGDVEDIAPLNLPADLRPLVAREGTVFDFVGFYGRVYVVVESGLPDAKVRRAFSVAFDKTTKRSEYRAEPLLESLPGYRLVTFDDALYALNRSSGRMFRFGRTSSNTLEEPRPAASAIKEDSAQNESMIGNGLFLPFGRVLAILTPSAVPSIESLERFGLVNVLGYTAGKAADPNSIPQDLVYNPQKNYWARCGHDLDAKSGAVAAFRPAGSRRVWVIHPNGETHTLAAGSESLFAHDYVRGVATAALPPYLNKQRQFRITNGSSLNFTAMSDKYQHAGLTGFSATGPSQLLSPLPEVLKRGGSEPFMFRYNEADPVPIHVRFQVERPAGCKHDYFLEVTFSGPDLGAATSVFKRIDEDSKGALSVVEIPGTTVKYTTNKPCVLPIPKPLVDGFKLRVHNATTYTLWLRPADRGYFGGDIKLAYDTPPLSIYAHGAGELPVNVDLSLPPGIEIASGSAPQRKMISIDTSRSTGLRPEILSEAANLLEFRVSYVRTSDINGVYIGDGVATDRSEAIFLPVALPDNQTRTRVIKLNPGNLSIAGTYDSRGRGVFAMPNSIGVTAESVVTLFDREVDVTDLSLQYQMNQPYLSSVFTGFLAHHDGDLCLLEMSTEGAPLSNVTNHYRLRRGVVARDYQRRLVFSMTAEILLDDVRGFRPQNAMPGFPNWVPPSTSPMAFSPSIVSVTGERIRDVAICVGGGLFVVGRDQRSIRTLALQSAGREEAVVFGRDGVEIFCAHSQADNEGLRISRVDNKTMKQTHSLSLPRGEGVADLTTDTRQRRPNDLFKASRSASMVRTLDGKWLFVSHGRSIFRIEAATLTLRETFKVDLPCRVFHVWGGQPTQDSHGVYGSPGSCILLYAIGASYTGDGTTAKDNQFKTQLYKLGIRE